MKALRRRRPSGITTLSVFEFLGAISCIGLLFFIAPGSRDFIALGIAAGLGFIVVYSLWTLQFWAVCLTAVYEAMELASDLFLLTHPESRRLHLFRPVVGFLLR